MHKAHTTYTPYTPDQLKALLSAEFPQLAFKYNHPLAGQTYFKIGGTADAYLEVLDLETLQKILAYTNEHGIRYTVLGGASNVLVADAGLRGLVIKIVAKEITHTTEGEQGLLTAQVGIQTALLVSKSVALGFTGLEKFLGVPGTVGGAVYNNAHYLDDLIGTHITRVQVVDQTGKAYWLSQEECAFGYDSSRFHTTNEVLFCAEFRLQKGDLAQSQKSIRDATEYRARTQPLGIPSSGCIFQNTPNTPDLKKQFEQFADKSHVPAGFLIDQAGLKKTQVGGISVSEKHAAWMINDGTGSADDVRELVAQVKQAVDDRFGVTLQEEVFYLE